MRTGIIFEVSSSDRLRLEGVVRDRNTAQKHVWCASIILLPADEVGTAAIMRQTGKSKTCVWRRQERFMAEGVDGLLRDKTRPSRIARLGPEVVERVVALTLADAPDDALDGGYDGRSQRDQRQCGAPHLESAWAATALLPAVQTVE